MKTKLTALLFLALLGCMNSVVFAAELLDVKPVVAGSAVSIEISADIAMTYTFYKIPGQARAVVDIAEADPEKVEPLIVVNKGAVSSISVDKALISGIVVSRIIFNLVSESDIAVAASSDRKLLTVTFSGSGTAAALKPELKPEPIPVPSQPEPVAKAETQASAETPPLSASAAPDDDPLGLNEPVAKPAAVAAETATAVTAAASELPQLAAPTVMRIPKLEPVVPAITAPAQPHPLTIQEITTGATYIDIRTNRPVTDFKATKISGPDRLFIDIPAEKITQKAKSISIAKFGVAKARIGVSPKSIRIVFDSGRIGFPAYTISKTENGLRIHFK